MPVVKFSEEEQQIWNQMKEMPEDGDEAPFVEATEKLFAIREKGTPVSALTSELISFEDINM